MIWYWTLRAPQSLQNYKFCILRHTQSTGIWMDGKKATIVPDDEYRVMRGDIKTLKWSRYMYIVR